MATNETATSSTKASPAAPAQQAAPKAAAKPASKPVAKAAVKTAKKPAAKPAVSKGAAAKKAAKPAAKTAVATAKKTTVSVPKAAVAAKPAKEKKIKMVRDSLTMPKLEYVVLEELKLRAAKMSTPVKKTELIRAGIKALAGMNDAAFMSAVRAVPSLKTGRPSKEK
jgi:hypothetical protein